MRRRPRRWFLSRLTAACLTQAPGLSSLLTLDQWRWAWTKASCTASAAASGSPATRVRARTIGANSRRNKASRSICPGALLPSHASTTPRTPEVRAVPKVRPEMGLRRPSGSWWASASEGRRLPRPPGCDHLLLRGCGSVSIDALLDRLAPRAPAARSLALRTASSGPSGGRRGSVRGRQGFGDVPICLLPTTSKSSVVSSATCATDPTLVLDRAISHLLAGPVTNRGWRHGSRPPIVGPCPRHRRDPPGTPGGSATCPGPACSRTQGARGP